MAWITPKKDWDKATHFTPTDYNRIKNNLIYVNDMLNEKYPDVAVELDLGADVGYDAKYYPSMFTAFEDAIDSFARIGEDLSVGTRGYYNGNDSFIDYKALNRIESITLRYYEYDPSVKSVTISPSTFNVYVGYTTQLTASVLPVDSEYILTWSSSDNTILTVNSNGVVTGIAEGTAQIIVTVSQTGRTDKTATSIGVAEVAVIESASMNTTKYTFGNIGETCQLVAEITPSESDYTIAWSSSDDTIATVDSNGLVTAISVGSVVITATITDNVSGETYTTTSTFTITIELTDIVENFRTYRIKKGETKRFTFQTVPSGAVVENATFNFTTGIYSSLYEKVKKSVTISDWGVLDSTTGTYYVDVYCIKDVYGRGWWETALQIRIPTTYVDGKATKTILALLGAVQIKGYR